MSEVGVVHHVDCAWLAWFRAGGGCMGDPPDGWLAFGAHADPDVCSYPGALAFSDERGEDGFPLWERHDGCSLTRTDR